MTGLTPAFLISKRQDPPPPPQPRARRSTTPPADQFSDDDLLLVDFNPATLRLTYNNQFGDGKPYSHARETVAKLDVELIFDTTEYGASVMGSLSRLATMTRSDAVAPATPSSGTPPPPSGKVPVIEFHWGGKVFEGVVESMTQTIEYWSLEGIPLRATVQLSLKETAKTDPTLDASASQPDPAAFATAPVTPASTDGSDKPATDAATKGGNPAASRSIAAFNGLESMRGGVGGSAGAGASIGVSASVNLTAAAGFAASGGVSAGAGAGASLGFGLGASAGASAGAGIGAAAGVGMAGGASLGAGAGIGMGAGAGIGIGAGVGIGAGASVGAFAGASASAGAFAGASAFVGTSASASAGAFAGASASAGRSAADGAFGGLGRSKTIVGNTGIDPSRLIPPAPPVPVGADARFDSTGCLLSDGSSAVAQGYVRIF